MTLLWLDASFVRAATKGLSVKGMLLTQDIMLANYDLAIVGRHLKVQHASMQCFAMWRQAPFAKSCCFSRQRPERHAAVLTLHGHEIEANVLPYTKCYLGARHLLRYFNEYFSFLGCNRGFIHQPKSLT